MAAGEEREREEGKRQVSFKVIIDKTTRSYREIKEFESNDFEDLLTRIIKAEVAQRLERGE